MKNPKPITVDFETLGILKRPQYPPVPVGVSIKYWGKAPKYYAWGHPTENNCTWTEGRNALLEAWQHPGGLLFHNSKFDVDVATTHMDLEMPRWHNVHDTLFLLFLNSPHEQTFSLKPSAARLLDMPPDEQDAVADWLVENQPIPGVKISKSKMSEHYAGRYIAYAPGKLVGEYANGDTIRTEKLFELLWSKTLDQGMFPAYNRERELMLYLLDMERQGVPVDAARLKRDVKMYSGLADKLDGWVKAKIKRDVNINSGDQLMAALIDAGLADEEAIPLTKTGKYQTNKEALMGCIIDKQLVSVLHYRSQLLTCLNTFMKPWLKVAEISGGLIFTTWHQTKSGDSDFAGTKSGRLSSTPNFQNIPTEFKPLFAHEASGLPESPFTGLPPLPVVRSYIVPFEGHVLIDRDYSQQEPRLLAEFDQEGTLRNGYLANPWMDIHDATRDKLAERGKFYERKPVKNTNLGLIYGMGVSSLAERNGMPVHEAKSLKNDILGLYPGLGKMYKDMRWRAKNNVPVTTWGGRVYYCEPPKMVGGRIREFDYKLVNILIQGSAADVTKQAIIQFYRVKKPAEKLLLNIHDQLTVSTPVDEIHESMAKLMYTMEDLELEVPMLTEGKFSLTNFSSLVDYDKKGESKWQQHLKSKRGPSAATARTTSARSKRS